LRLSRPSARLCCSECQDEEDEGEVPFDPVLFAAAVPARKPTPKDLADTTEDKDDAIEPQQYDSMEDMVGPHGIVSK